MAFMQLILSDLVLSFMCVWSGALIKLFVYKILGFGFEIKGEILKASLSILSMLLFAWLSKKTNGGSYNPVAVLSGAASAGNFSGFLFTVGARIPAQVLGYIAGVKYFIEAFPQTGHGPPLNVDIYKGALIEGLLTFAIVIIALGLARTNRRSFFIKTWILSVSRLTLQTLGSDLTGGSMNPASAMGWAYARGDHITKEHIIVYWLAPIQATLLGILTFGLLVQPQKLKEEKMISKRNKSD
ncbi:probable aquaporin SIP2-1 [Macadamia integrifolia]|uniref:probable aquaporin SIP2-1 n=1 Tax=Macadamia integrifolia TaxID=60698 RepID=UPI001C4E6033|nr:probable aquaporin SIP2-1 [Macadamia integrifolia]